MNYNAFCATNGDKVNDPLPTGFTAITYDHRSSATSCLVRTYIGDLLEIPGLLIRTLK